MIEFKKPGVEQFFQTYGIQTFAVRPDEKQLVFSTNLNGKYNLWGMDLPNTFPYPLTAHDQSTSEIGFEPNGKYIVAISDEDGDENGQIYAVPTQGGELVDLRTAEGKRHMGTIFSEDGRYLYYSSTKDDETFLKIYRYDIENDEEEIIVHGDGAATFLIDVSPDGKSVVYGKHISNTSNLLYVQHDGKSYPLTDEEGPDHTFGGVVFTSDNDIYFTTNYGADQGYLAKYDIKKEKFEKMNDFEGQDISNLKYDKENELLYVVSHQGVVDRLFSFDLFNGVIRKVDTPCDVIEQLKVSKSGNVYILGRSATIPFNIYQLVGEKWSNLTNFGVPGVSQDEMSTPEIVKYPSFDGLEIEALFFRAKPENDNGHVILWPHGGPQAAERSSFRALFQFLVHRGYSIFAPNFRGSSGYGLKYMKMVEGDWGHGPRLDNVEGLEWLIREGYVDRDKILLMGGSYGGYMALLLHGRHSKYFKAVVDIFGVSNLFSFIESVPEHWKPIMEKWVGDPVKDKVKLEEDTPITYLDSMDKPMLVIQGAKDPRVVKAESDQIVEALRDKGIHVEYLVLDDEGHGFSKKENEIKVYQKVLEFFDQFID
ncbi:S9 family peptidase [Halalkalibacillus sediminis]|uniref:S9 family peptidase n=1 Tax=Halalkalibacillus sediminis TaxID=2018042 RepID=A0A2I0QT69_9BACI|nr:S9 family peptidase [Halalkalibacillus sediminis]PKR77310.1 S9 family peptidase [Halalkalibacillus sediminis]